MVWKNPSRTNTARSRFRKTGPIQALIILLGLLGAIPLQAHSRTHPSSVSSTSKIQVQGEWFYRDGKPFLVRAIGYAPWRPHQWPSPPDPQVDPDLIDLDFQRIRAAGFNTIRSWGALNKKELQLARQYDLWVIQGIWLDPNKDYSNPIDQNAALAQIRHEIALSSDQPHILMYLVITELKPGAALVAGTSNIENFFREIVEAVHETDPHRPVSMDSWLPIAFLDHSMWDVVTFNTFAFAPECITQALSFEEYNRWLKENIAKGKPFFIGETGGYSVSPSSWGVHGGSGGHNEAEQSRLNRQSLIDVTEAGSAGWTLVSWIDTWHYPDDPHTHNPAEPWEWDGIVGIPTDGDLRGIPRQIFYDLPGFMRAINLKFKRVVTEAPPQRKKMISIRETSNSRRNGYPIEIQIVVQDMEGRPLTNQSMGVAFFVPEPWQERFVERTTDSQGQLRLTSPFPVQGKDQLLIVAAGIKNVSGKAEASEILFLFQR